MGKLGYKLPQTTDGLDRQRNRYGECVFLSITQGTINIVWRGHRLVTGDSKCKRTKFQVLTFINGLKKPKKIKNGTRFK